MHISEIALALTTDHYFVIELPATSVSSIVCVVMSKDQGAHIVDSLASPSHPCLCYSLHLLAHFVALYSLGELPTNEHFYECLHSQLVEQSKKGLRKG